MPRNNYFVCCGVCLFYTIAVHSQSPRPLPRNPTIKQVVGYHLQEQYTWGYRQLPRNAVLYRANILNPVLYADAIRQQQNSFRLTSPPFILKTTAGTEQTGFLQDYLKQQRKDYSNWMKNSWWKDPQNGTGSDLLRSILQRNRGVL